MKQYCLANPIKLLLFFQNKARIAGSFDNEFIVISFLCMTTVHIVSVYANTGCPKKFARIQRTRNPYSDTCILCAGCSDVGFSFLS